MENVNPPKNPIAPLDDGTDALFQAISEASNSDINELVRTANVDPAMFAAFLKSTGQEGTPAAKIIQDALNRITRSPDTPPAP